MCTDPSRVHLQNLKEAILMAKAPAPDWGPAEEANRTGRYARRPGGDEPIFTVSGGQSNKGFEMN